MSKVILCRGIQGSGKTTWSKEYCNKNVNTIRVNRDDIREMFGIKWSKKLEAVVKSCEFEAIRSAINMGFNVVVDDVSNLNIETESVILSIIRQYNRAGFTFSKNHKECILIHKDFFIPLEECIKNDSKRVNPIGRDVITHTYNKYSSIINPQCEKNDIR